MRVLLTTAFCAVLLCLGPAGVANADERIYVTGGGYGPLYSNAHMEVNCFNCKAHAETWINGATGMTCANGTKNSYGACQQTGKAATVFPSSASPVAVDSGWHFNCWTGVGRFFLIRSTGAYEKKAELTRSICIDPPRRTSESTTTCPIDGPYWCPGTPIVIPLSNTPLKLSSPDVPFDINDDGVLEIVSWPEEASQFAFLAIDKNGDGIINSGAELFGDRTVAGADDGFSALLAMVREELGGDPPIAEVNESAALFARLLLWTDRNRDGVSQPGELRAAGEVLQAVGLGMTITGRKDPEGNQFRYKGWARYRDGRVRKVYDVILAAGRQ